MKILEHGLVYDSEKEGGSRQACCCTSFKQLRSGKVLASFRLGSGKDTADGNCMIAESADQGRNWKIITDRFNNEFQGASGEIRVAELAELDNGQLAAFLIWVDRSAGAKLYNGESDSVLPTKLLMTLSTDGGYSWGPCRLLNTGELAGPSISGQAITLPGKGTLVPFENFQAGSGIHSAHSLFLGREGSLDKVLPVVRDPADTLYFFDERHAFSPETSKLTAMFWTYNIKTEKDIEIHISEGDPESLTWEKPVSTGIKGQVCQPIPLPDGRLAAFYVHRHPPGSLRLIISDDNGRNWDFHNELTVHEDDSVKQAGLNGESDYAQYWEDMLTVWNFGHPTAVILEDGSLLLGYYAGPHGKCLSVHWARIKL